MSDEQAKRYIVWLCAGCDECEPPDGERVRGPCDSPSLNGAEVVKVEALESAERELQALKTALKTLLDEMDQTWGIPDPVENDTWWAGLEDARRAARAALDAGEGEA